MTVEFSEIFCRPVDLAVLLDELGDQIIDRFETFRLPEYVPARNRDDIVPGAGLSLGGQGQQYLVPVGADEIDLEIDLFPGGPGFAQFAHGRRHARDWMVPEKGRQFPGCVTRRGQRATHRAGRRSRRF